MDQDIARRAQELLEQVLDLEPARRADFLDETCRDDPTLRREVESLLRAHDAAGTFLDAPALVGVPEPGEAGPSMVGRTIGRYSVRSLVASGGMGTVYLAEQEEPRRTVALKMMRAGLAAPSARQRFQYESQVLARLQHPNIAQVFEAGMYAEHPDAEERVPWFAMEHVADAVPLTEYATSRRLATRERLELFILVCDAVNHGHQRGIVHRDLKPANILVAGSGEPKVIDFGVARATDADVALTTVRTDVGQLIGTLQYMSPEQCEADPAKLDARSDVYALGVVLYELLTDRLPYDVGSRPVFEAARLVREAAPARPSTHDRAIRGDLETITFKALEKERGRRYQSAEALADDLRRFLAHEPIRARPPTFLYQIRMFARRNTAFVGAVAAVMVVLAVAAAVSLVFAVRAGDERDAAIWRTYVANIAAAESAHQAGEFGRMRASLTGAPAEHRGWEWRHMQRQAEPSLRTMRGLERGVTAIAVSPAGDRLAAVSGERVIRQWDPTTGATLATLTGHEDAGLALAFAPGGARLASGSRDHTIRIWDAARGETLHTLRGHEERVNAVVFDASGEHLVSGALDGTIRFWDAATGEAVSTLRERGLNVWALALSPDGTRLAAGLQNELRVWDLLDDAPPRSFVGHRHLVASVAISPDGSRLASASWDGTARVWDLASGDTLVTFEGHDDRIVAVAFSPDGARIATGARDKTVRIWDAITGVEMATLRGHEGEIVSVAFFADGRRLASGSSDRTMRIWAVAPGEDLDVLRGHVSSHRVSEVAFSPDGTRLASVSSDGTTKLWSTVTGATLATLRGRGDELVSVAYDPDGTRLASASREGFIVIWNTRTGEEVRRIHAHDRKGANVVFGPDGDLLVSGSIDGTIALWDPGTGAELARMHSRAGRLAMAFGPDGTCFVSGASDGSVTVWDVATRAERMTLDAHDDVVHAVAFSPDGTVLASASADRTIRLWDVATGAPTGTLRGHEHAVASLAFSPDGARLASGSSDKTVKIWDPARGRDLATLHGHARAVHAVAFSPDGTRLASASAWGEALIRFWDTVPREVRRREREAALVLEAEMTPEVDRRLAETRDAAAVARTIESDATLSVSRRRAALDALLRRVAARVGTER